MSVLPPLALHRRAHASASRALDASLDPEVRRTLAVRTRRWLLVGPLIVAALLPLSIVRAQGSIEFNTNRSGSDYSNFNLPSAQPALCRDACAADARCQAWTYVKPNTVQGALPRCWLKNGVPVAQSNPCCDSGIKGDTGTRTGTGTGTGTGVRPEAIRPGVNLPGMDYRNFPLSVADPGACRDACAGDPRCRAWTYVRPNTVQGTLPRCWLKGGVPVAQSNPCCDSGIKGDTGTGTGTGNTPGPGPLPWGDPAGRGLVNEWLRQVESCTREVYPAAYVDEWARICGRVPTGTIDCSRTPDNPAGWDSSRYLWEHDFCTPYLAVRLRDYVARRAAGASAQSLRVCKRDQRGPCF